MKCIFLARMSRPAKFLVIRFSSIGDIVLTTPVLRAIEEQMEGDSEIHFLTKKAYAPLVESNPRVSKVYSIEKATAEVMEELKEEQYDYIIDLHRNIRSRMVKRSLKMIDFTFKKYNKEKWLLVNFGVNKMPDKHIVDRYLDTLKAFSVQADDKGLEFYVPPGEEINIQELFPNLKGAFHAIAIGAAHIGKRMEEDFIAQLCEGSELPVIIIGGPSDVETSQSLEGQFPGKVFNAAGKLSVNGSASVIAQATKVVAGDTGMMHIAAAMNRPVISVWGCTTPDFGMYPYKPAAGSVIIEPEGLNKRPCSKLGDRCKYGKEERCITQIDPARIISHLTRQ